MNRITALTTEQHGVMSCVYLRTAGADTLTYLACEAAIASGAIEVREVGEHGTVNAIEVVNHSDHFVFMMDGDMLEGAKQTRVLNTSVFFAPRSRTVAPVSCVEQGRWQYTSRHFRASQHVAPRSIRARKSADVAGSLRSGQRHMADQSAVWKGVRGIDERNRVASPTSSLADAYDHLQSGLDPLLASFTGHPDANGFALFVGRHLLCIDVFNRRDVCASYLPKILRAVAIEAGRLDADIPMPKSYEASFRAVDFLDRMEQVSTERHPGAAIGEELRFNSEQATGFRLEYNSELVHETLLVLERV
jgi:hypothetical protein